MSDSSSLGGAAIGAAGSLASGIVGGIGGAIQGHKNRKFMREQNQLNRDWQADMWKKQSAFQEQMFDKQKAWQTDMWNKQNEYMSPAQQRARMEAAGINPQLMMNPNSLGTASSVPTAPQGSSPSAGSPSMMGGQITNPSIVPSIMNGIQDFANNFATRFQQSKLLSRQARLLDIEASTKGAENMAKIGNIIADTKNKEVRKRLEQTQLKYADESYSIANDLGRQNIELAKNDILLRGEQIYSERMRNSILPYQLKQELSESLARTDLLRRQGDLTSKQAEKIKCEKYLLQVEGYVANHSGRAKIRKEVEEAKQMIYQNKFKGFDEFVKFVDSLPVIGSFKLK